MTLVMSSSHDIGTQTSCLAMTVKRLRNSGIVYHLKRCMEAHQLTIEELYASKYAEEILEKYYLQYPKSIIVFMTKYGVFLDK